MSGAKMKTDKSASTSTTQFDAKADAVRVFKQLRFEPGLLGCGLLGSEPKFAPPSACSKLRSDPNNPCWPARMLCPELGSDPKTLRRGNRYDDLGRPGHSTTPGGGQHH